MLTAALNDRPLGCCLTLVALAWLNASVADARADELLAAKHELAAKYQAKLSDLAVACSEQGLDQSARRLENWLPRQGPYQLALFTPANMREAAADLPPQEALQKRLAFLRRAYANALFKLARRAADDGRATLAMTWATETLREDTDHEQARLALGFEQYDQRWATPAEVRQLRGGRVWHERFGWLPKEHVARYEDGQRYFNGRWITAARESRLHSDISRGWQIETGHYQVTTNHSLEAGVSLALQLERFHDVWRQLFAGYYLGDDELQRMVQRGVQPRLSRRLHRVVYFRNRDEYNAALAKIQPGIENTLGIYFGDVRTAYFFAGEDQDAGTVYHEATHQLFQEMRPSKAIVALRDNFWIVEGIACYMESLRFMDDYAVIGGLEKGRVPAARVRMLKDGFYVPFDALVTYGSRQVQQDPRIRTLYSQFAGQAAFLMHFADGRYRDAASKYLQEVYRGTARPATLAGKVDISYAQLDQQYREFLQGPPPAGDR